MKKIILISLALVLAMGSLGVGYAMWSDTVTIGGPVQTGTLNLALELEPIPCKEQYWVDDGDGIIEPNEWVAGEYDGKEVGSCSATLADPETDPVTDKSAHETLNIVVDNAYPGYAVFTTFLLHNIGTVPLDLILYSISGEKQELDGTKIYDLLWGPVGDYNWQPVYEDVDMSGSITPGDPEVINFRITNSLPAQIDPCHVDKREVDLHFKQPLQQEKKYVFTVVITAQQWAE
jgi:predicted ribosomally synthesized peptide with SipW-like signal peptide